MATAGNFQNVRLLLLLYFVMEVNKSQQLTSTGGPVIMQRPSNITVVDGQRVVLPCIFEGFPQPITTTWYKDTVDIRTTDSFAAQRISILEDGSLLIKPAVKGDRAWYTCKASNSMGSDEAPAYFNVIYKPEVLAQKMPTEIVWARGYLQQIDCPVDSNPPLQKVLWTKDQNAVNTIGRFDILSNGTLLVSNVEESDAGSYKCTPYNMMGSGPSSPRVQVLVKDPPQIIVSPQPLYIRNLGETVQMGCEATGKPAVSIQWIKVGSKLEGDPRITVTDKYLEIKGLTKDDHGKYECRAINDIATVVSVTELRIDKTTPYAPYNVTVVPGVFNVTVSWEPAYDGGTPQHYFVWFRAAADTQWQPMNVPVMSSTFINLHGLQADTEYEFKICARNAYGDGTFSPIVKQRTLAPDSGSKRDTTPSLMEYDPVAVNSLPVDNEGRTYYPDITENRGPHPSAPQNLTAQVRSKDILLNWKVPVTSPVPIFSYKIEYTHENSNWMVYPDRVTDGSVNYAEMKDMPGGSYNIRLRSYGVLAFSSASNSVRVIVPSRKPKSPGNANADASSSSDDLVLPEALIGGIIGGVLFLLVAVLLALVAIFHSRKKERKAKAKYNDVTYGKPDEMNGRHEPSTKWDRWQHHGGGDFMTLTEPTDGIFFLPQTRRLDQSADMRTTTVQDAHRHGGEGAGRQVPLTHDISIRSDRSQAGSFQVQPEMKNMTWTDQGRDVNTSHQPSLKSLPASYGHMTQSSYPPLQHYRTEDTLPPALSRDLPALSKSYSFPSHHPTVMMPTLTRQHPGHSSQILSQPGRHQRSQSGSSLREAQQPSFQSEDDEVFDQAHTPMFPRHSSMKPSQMTYLTEAGTPLFGAVDISSVLEPHSEPVSQHHPNHSASPSTHPINNFSFDGNIPAPGFYISTGDTNRPFAMVTPSHHVPSDNDSNNSSGRPLGYTRDHLQGVVQRLRGPRSHSAGPSTRYANVSGYSDPLPQSRANLFVPPKVSKSHSNLQDPDYYNTVDRRGTPCYKPEPWRGHGDQLDDSQYMRTPLDSSDVKHPPIQDKSFRRPSSQPLYADSTSRMYVPQGHQDDASYNDHYRQPPPKPPHHPQHPALLKHQHQFDPRYTVGRDLRRGGPVQHYSDDLVAHDSGSSGIWSRNTSQSTGPLHPHRRGSTGKGSTSVSSAHDPDISMDAGQGHRRDTSGDENYEFDSLNALENDIMDDLRRYSRLSGATGSQNYPHPSRPSRYPDSDRRFMKLREEFKQYRQQQLHPDEDLQPPPTATSALPIGQNGEPLYPMDSEML